VSWSPEAHFSLTNQSFENCRENNEQVEKEGEDEDLIRSFQNLGIEQRSSSGATSSNNPFLNPQSTTTASRYHPFIVLRTNSHSYSNYSSRPLTNNPFVARSAYPAHRDHPSGGYLTPQASPYFSRRRSATPAVSSGYHLRYGDGIRRPRTSQGPRSLQSSDRLSVPSTKEK
jgi:hypothetical protein